MIPESKRNFTQFTVKKQPSFTYRLDIQKERVRGETDQLEAMRQAIYKILNTERYENIIYSWNYGIELKDLFGRSKGYVCSELPRRITEALTQDDRISEVDQFQFSTRGNQVHVTFCVKTDFGSLKESLEVKV